MLAAVFDENGHGVILAAEEIGRELEDRFVIEGFALALRAEAEWRRRSILEAAEVLVEDFYIRALHPMAFQQRQGGTETACAASVGISGVAWDDETERRRWNAIERRGGSADEVEIL